MIVAASRPLNMNSCVRLVALPLPPRYCPTQRRVHFPQAPLGMGDDFCGVANNVVKHQTSRCVVAKPTKHTEIDLFPMSRAIRFGTRTKIRGIFRAAQELDLMEDSGRYGIISS